MRRRLLLIALAFAVFLPTALWLVLQFRPKEPTVGGVPLLTWLSVNSFSQIDKELAQIGPEAVPWLIKGLEAQDSAINRLKLKLWRKLPNRLKTKWRNYQPINPRELRSNSAYALQLLGPEATQAVPRLIVTARSDPDAFVRQVALSALAQMTRDSRHATAVLLEFLQNGDSVLRSQVAGAIYSADIHPIEALPFLLSQLDNYQQGNSTSDKPLNEMLAISRYGAEASNAGPMLVKYITRGEGRGNFLNALKAIGPGAAPAVPHLLQMLEDRSPPGAGEASIDQTKPLIFQVFKNTGPRASAALPALTNALQDPNGVVRALAAAAIGRITSDNDFVVPLLVKELENRRWSNNDQSLSYSPGVLSLGLNQRQTAALLLGEIGPPAAAALPNLKQSLKSGDMWLPAFAAQAVWQISSDADAILPSLTNSLRHNDLSRRILTLRVLAQMGPAAKTAAPAIRDTLKTHMHIRREAREAREALQRIEPSP